MTIFSAEEMDKGLKRLGLSGDARFLRQCLMETLVTVASPGLSDGAVRHLEGRRSFAAELIASLGLNSGNASGDGADGSGYVRSGSGSRVGGGHSGPERRVPPTADDE